MTWTRACAASELEDDKPLSVDVDGTLVALVRHDGELAIGRQEFGEPDCRGARIDDDGAALG